jgi:DNA-binding transcriptional LysR family regulator
MQDLIAMAYFVHVVDRGGFTAAARHLSAPLSTISRRIAELERSLGIRLLERSTRKVRVTSLGENYLEYCRRGLQEFESATLAVRNRQSEVSGLLRISVPPNLVEPFFLPAATEFQARYPNARLAILSTERHVDLLHERIDVAFRIGPLKDSRMTVRKIASYASYLVAAPAYLAGQSPIEAPDDLSTHRIVAFDGGTGRVTWSLRRAAADQSVAIELLPHLAMNDFAGILAATLRGCGAAWVPSILCAAHLRAGALTRVLPDWTFERSTISAVMPGNRNISRLIRLFLDHCAEVLPRSLADAECAIAGDLSLAPGTGS